MFQIFGKVNAKTGVPMEGTIITGLISAIIALFFDLDILLDMISIGTLLAFTVVCGGIIILRYQPPEEENRGWKIPIIIGGYFIGCVIFAARQKLPLEDLSIAVDVIIWLIFAIPMVVFFVLLLLQPHLNIPKSFKTPLVPWIPCGGILMNIWFILSLSIDSIYRLLIWTFIGMTIYFLYSYRHSNLATKRFSLVQ
jgi:amino acid transporter